jgi:hypothetical protein
MVLSNPTYKRLVSIISMSTRLIRAWHSSQNKTLRSADVAQEWLLRQCTGEFMNHLSDVLRSLQSHTALTACGFLIPADKDDVDEASVNMDILIEDEFAEKFGNLVTSLIALRQRRCLWMIGGWPTKMTTVLERGPATHKVIGDFKLDIEVWEHFKGVADKSVCGKLVEKRHVFNLVCNQQYSPQGGRRLQSSLRWFLKGRRLASRHR